MLSGPEQLQWIEAFSKAFSTQEFKDLVFYRLDDDVENYASSALPKSTMMGEVIAAYSRRDIEGRLIAKATELRPSNAAIALLARQKNAVAAPSRQEAERLIIATNSQLDMEVWIEKAVKRQVCVCRIEIPLQGGGTAFGTGFLIGADRLMTNYHVMEPVLAFEDHDASYDGPLGRAEDVRFRFDYKVLSSGGINKGSTFKLAPKWRLALSRNNPDDRPPNEDELDFAVVQLAEPVGSMPIGDKHGAPGEPRGWIELPDGSSRPDFEPGTPLYIIQHPEGEPIKLNLDTDAILGLTDNRRLRVRYTTNSERGSSGSPCFDQNWELIALHHSGDPNFAPQYNEGIPIDTIARRLALPNSTGNA